ncbi:unnamed protein product [Rotaria sp. Silwood1]|nr:unnamed protein product [Rotaria sp. Silwood1]
MLVYSRTNLFFDLHFQVQYIFNKTKQRQLRYVHKAQYIPLKESLIELLKKPEVFETLNCRTRSNVMTDLSTGSFCEQHSLFRVPNSLKIILFYDDLTINNPLGSRSTSVGMFYWTLANLPRIDVCFCWLVVKKKYLKQYGFVPVLEDFFQTIEQLETDGLSIIIDQKAYVFQGSLFLVCGDLLGLAQIHGFKCAFRQGWKPLFYCDVNRDGLRRINKGSDCQLRTLDKYEKNYMAIEFATGLEKTKLQKKFGIISYSPLRKIRNFDIFQQTAIDIMHVLLEGICQRELKLLFKQIHHEKFATLVSLSTMIRSFQYGSSESSPSNKFNLLSEENEVKFRLSASEMFTLIKYIPLVFYQARLLQSICTSSYWLSFLQLREIVSISFASEIDTTTIKQLEKLVTRYLITFDNAYGYVQRLPKHHLLVHLGDQMDRFGPLRFTSCMIFEKKHSFFKKMKYRNFRNIAVTLARRRQHYIAAQMYTSNNTSTSSFLYSGHKIQKVKELHSSAATQHHLLDSKRTLYETRQVTLFGITYAVGDVVLINDYIFPIDRVFGKILIVIVQDKIMSFSLTALVQYGEETEIVDIYVGLDLPDVHAQLVAPFHLDSSQCIIQVFESKIFNEYVNLSKLSLLNNMNSGRFRILPKKVDTMSSQSTTPTSIRLVPISSLQSVSPQCLNQTITSSSSSLSSPQDSLSISYKDPLDEMSFNDDNDQSELESFDFVEQSTSCQRDSKCKRALFL